MIHELVRERRFSHFFRSQQPGKLPVIHELVRERRFSHFFRSQQPGKLPVIHELVRERQFRPVFEAGNQSKYSKTVHSRRRLPPAKDAISSWFVVVHVVVQMSWFMSWFKCHGSLSWFTVMVHCHGSWWFMVVRGGFSLKFSRKYHVTNYLTNQSPRFSIKSHFE